MRNPNQASLLQFVPDSADSDYAKSDLPETDVTIWKPVALLNATEVFNLVLIFQGRIGSVWYGKTRRRYCKQV